MKTSANVRGFPRQMLLGNFIVFSFKMLDANKKIMN